MLKFIVKKEGLPPVARRIKEENSVPVFLQRRQLTKMCQAIERALSASVVVISTLLILLHRDRNTLAAAANASIKRGGSAKTVAKACKRALAEGGGCEDPRDGNVHRGAHGGGEAPRI